MTPAIPITDWRLLIRRSHSAGKRCAYVNGATHFDDSITTSALVSADGCVVTTRSGSRYRLDGPPAEMFAPELGTYDPAAPLDHAPERLGFGWWG